MKPGRPSLLGIILALACLLCACAPDTTDIYGKPIRIADFRGKWVVINYWATWCATCIETIPALNQLAKYYGDKVVVFGVNVDHLTSKALQGLAKGYVVEYSLLSSFPIERWRVKPHNLPTTYIVDPKGHLYKTLVGPQTLADFQSVMHLLEVDFD